MMLSNCKYQGQAKILKLFVSNWIIFCFHFEIEKTEFKNSHIGFLFDCFFKKNKLQRNKRHKNKTKQNQRKLRMLKDVNKSHN